LPRLEAAVGSSTKCPDHWGLIPSWAKDPKVGFSTFNARADGSETKPAFKEK
jgi:putative SOS response-associated peptidase YedK